MNWEKFLNTTHFRSSSMNISGMTALVTGGASGLGGGAAAYLAERGAHVVIFDRDAERGNAHAAALGDHTFFVEGDVTSEQDVQRAVDLARERFGGLHILVNCAGIGWVGRTVSKEGPHALDLFARVIQINLIGTFNCIRLAANAMSDNVPNAEGERGVIVNTASVAAFDGQIGQAAYSASKGGIVGMTLPIARDLSRLGIRVCTLAPGIFDTPLLAALPEAARLSLGQQVPFPSRLGRPEEFAHLVGTIIENPMLNGETIRLDGAIRMAPK
jgi:NAD(P)-dependent dehydrogenase (short-subunit alcohol dehydrogenase family)